ncbi:MAG: hypothetical protein MUD12_03080 [Spirochaetes bacterium]|nr:hypothetical protein [Spirochaetota bacterium]
MKKFPKIILAVLFTLFAGRELSATINSVTVTSAARTAMSGGNFYIAGSPAPYEFQVLVTSTAAALADYTNVDLYIELNGAGQFVLLTWTPGGGFAVSNSCGGTVNIATSAQGGTPANLDLRFRATFGWDINDAANSDDVAVRVIQATAVDNLVDPAPHTLTGNDNQIYGFCNRIGVVNFAQTDNQINPYTYSSTITGTVCYRLVGSAVNIADAVNTRSPGQAASIALRENGNATGWGNVGGDVVNATITNPYAGFLGAANLGNHNWTVLCNMNGPGGARISNSPGFITVQRIRVTGMTVTQGGGRDAPPNHWRSSLQGGTVFTLTAVRDTGGGPAAMNGNTTFTVNWNGGAQFTVTINNAATTGSVMIPAGSIPNPGAGTTTPLRNYYITQIQNANWGTQGDGTFGGAINQITDTVNYPVALYPNFISQGLFWENTDPPNGAAIASAVLSTTADTATITWLKTIDTRTALPSADADFHEYRVYFRETLVAGAYRIWGGNNDAGLRFAPPGTAAAGNITTILTSLKIFTQYDYYITGVDIFGNETTYAGGGTSAAPLTFTTQAFTLTATVGDGITFYTDFTSNNPVLRPLRETNVRVDVSIVTATGQPDSVTVWFTSAFTPTVGPPPHYLPDIVNDLLVPWSINTAAFPNAAPGPYLYSAAAVREASNRWVAYLPTTCPLIRQGNNIRFIIEMKKAGASTFTDTNTVTDGEPNHNPWAFNISMPAIFFPWPTRVLNNVITDLAPIAYPSYFLLTDAFVTIRVYDIKGRPVVTILENAYRKGGQNIKELGWAGTNKHNKKCGIGLYYMHIQARSIFGGKIILDKIKKVVIAR